MTPDARVRVVTDNGHPASEVEPEIVARPDPRRQRRRPTGPLRPPRGDPHPAWAVVQEISAHSHHKHLETRINVAFAQVRAVELRGLEPLTL